MPLIPSPNRNSSEDVVNTTLSELVIFLLFTFGILFVLQQLYRATDEKPSSCLWEPEITDSSERRQERGLLYAIAQFDFIYVRANNLHEVSDQIDQILLPGLIDTWKPRDPIYDLAINVLRNYSTNASNEYVKLSYSEFDSLIAALNQATDPKFSCKFFTTYNMEIDFEKQGNVAARIIDLANRLDAANRASTATTSVSVTAVVATTRSKSNWSPKTWHINVANKYRELCISAPSRIKCRLSSGLPH